MLKPLIYVASPYTKGDPGINVHFQCNVFNQLMEDGIVIPYMPLWSHFQHTVHPRPYEDWIEYDNQIIDQVPFAACLRLNAEVGDYKMADSSGADAEVERFLGLGRRVFYSIEELYAWVETLRR